jgi:hypothetical protein
MAESNVEHTERTGDIAAAAADVTVLQAFLSTMTNPASTIGQITTAFQALPAQLNDAGRANQVNQLINDWNTLTSDIQSMINAATIIANETP